MPLSDPVAGRIEAVNNAAEIVRVTMRGFYDAVDKLANPYAA